MTLSRPEIRFNPITEAAPVPSAPRYRKIPWFFWRFTRASSFRILLIRSSTSTVSPRTTASASCFSLIFDRLPFTAIWAKIARSIAGSMTISGRSVRKLLKTKKPLFQVNSRKKPSKTKDRLQKRNHRISRLLNLVQF